MANNIKGLSVNPKVEPRPNKSKEYRWSVRVKYKGESKDFATGAKSKDRGEVPPLVVVLVDKIQDWLISTYRQSGLLQEEFDIKSEYDNVRRVLNGDKPKDKNASPLVLDLIEDKLASIEKLNSSSKLITLRNHLEAFRPSLRAEEVTAKFKIQFLEYLNQNKLQSSSLRQLFAQLSGTLSFAFSSGKLPHNKYPFLKIKAYKGNQEKQCFTRGEYFLFNHLMRYCSERQKTVNSLPFNLSESNFEALSHLYLACLTGLRHSDLKALAGKELTIQGEGSKSYLVVGTSKTSKTLKIPLSKNAVWFIETKKVIKTLASEYYALKSGLEKIHKASLLHKKEKRIRKRHSKPPPPLKTNPKATIGLGDVAFGIRESESDSVKQERIDILLANSKASKMRPITEWKVFLEYFVDNLANGKANEKGSSKDQDEWLDTEEGKNWELAYEESLNNNGFLSREVYQTKVYTNTNFNETSTFPYWTKCSYHDGRRFFGSIYYHKTKDIDLVQKLLGHTTPAETSGYIVRWEEEKEEVNPLDIV